MMLLFLKLIVLVDMLQATALQSPCIECKLEFQVVNAGLALNGMLEDVVAEIQFNEKDLVNSHIVAHANPRNIRTGIAIRDKHLQRPDYFHAAKFERIKLASQSFRKIAKNRFEGMFTLTIKDVTGKVVIPFTVSHDHNATVYTAAFKINRLDYRLGEPSLILDDEVIISLTARVMTKR